MSGANFGDAFIKELQDFGGIRMIPQNTWISRLHLAGANAATAANYSTFDIIPVSAILKRVQVHYTTVGGAAATIQLERIQGTEANGAGDPLLVTPQALTATANTLYNAPLVNTAVTTFAAGDRLGAIDAGTLTGLTDLIVVCTFTMSSSIV